MIHNYMLHYILSKEKKKVLKGGLGRNLEELNVSK